MLLWGLVEVLVGVVFFGRRSKWLEMAIHLQGVFSVLVLVVVLVVVVVRGWFYSNGS
jgi:small-conductance mechanosensitive channel